MLYFRSDLERMYSDCGWVVAYFSTHLAFFHSHGLATWCAFLIDAGQEVLRDPQRVLEKGVVWMTGGCVL